MKLNQNIIIKELKENFNKKFPGLKVELYAHSHSSFEGSSANEKLSENLSLGDANPEITEGDIGIDPSMTVAQLECLFKDDFGLNVQVFRRSNAIWLQTVSTDE